MNLLPPPNEISQALRNYDHWQPGQEEIVMKMLQADTWGIALAAATGVGKSLIYQTWAEMMGWSRYAVLTATRGLQDQLGRDFPLLYDVRGMANYPCEVLMDRAAIPLRDGKYIQEPWHLRCDRGPCRGGVKCELANSGCSYFDAVRTASRALRVSTSYAFWLASHLYSSGLGPFDAVILDEAHTAPDELSRSVGVSISASDLIEWRLPTWPGTEAIPPWAAWAKEASGKLPAEAGDPETVRKLRDIKRRLDQLATMGLGRWAAEPGRDVWTMHPVWPADFAFNLWPGEVKKVVFSSATLTPKALGLLGVPPEKMTWVEANSPFPLKNRLVTWVPTVRVDHKTPYLEPWIRRIDQIISGRLDRKGIVHTTSYERARALLTSSGHRRLMISHDSARGTKEAVARFKAAPAPAILVSPSVVSGYDFPGDECEYQVIGKISFPDTRGLLMKTRVEEDKEYQYYLAALDLVQAVGRGVRTPTDRCETFIVDDHWSWFRKKAKAHFPKWFRLALRTSEILPHPPERK